MASRRLLSPLLRSPSRFSISNHNPTLSTPSQSPPRTSPYAHLLRNALLTGRRMLHTSSSITLHVKRRMNKEERLALVKAGREERVKYMARAAVKQKKEGGSSNKQKQQKYATCCKKGKGS